MKVKKAKKNTNLERLFYIPSWIIFLLMIWFLYGYFNNQTEIYTFKNTVTKKEYKIKTQNINPDDKKLLSQKDDIFVFTFDSFFNYSKEYECDFGAYSKKANRVEQTVCAKIILNYGNEKAKDELLNIVQMQKK